ncbi:histidine phosphatase superfamily [Lipomyces chichibuensis]|uniref:histidine phosphatase superfamily n=1 Tax=Lipomyces chichibuensis TaxID=1546026 RepID=UPI003343A199
MSTVLATPSYIKYESVPGYFLQDLDSTNAATFDFMTTNFGLINRSYSSSSNSTKVGTTENQTQWERFARHVWQLNEESDYGVEYKVLFIGRHGEGYHNIAESYYGTPAWNCYYSQLDGNETITWADAQLTPTGIAQAQAVNAFWAKQITEQKIPTPQKFYTSPLSRCCATAALTFTGLTLPASQPFIPEVKELLREWISGHTCDRRSNMSYIAAKYPTFNFEEGFQEVDPLWNANFVETSSAQNERSRTVLDDIFMNDPSAYISITTHSGEAASILSVLGHRLFSLSTGAVIPLLVRAETVTGRPPFRTWQPWTEISTCATPPPPPTPTTDEVKWSEVRMMRIQ